MRSFESGFLERQPIPHSLLRTIRLLGEYRGKETLFIQQTPQVLESLRHVAIIQSTESSNRIEGIEAPPERLKKLVEQKQPPKTALNKRLPGTATCWRPFMLTMRTCLSPLAWFFNFIVIFTNSPPSRAGDGR